jgi:16S rRNA (cytosine1402-N4)-methyltransferase
LGSASTPLGAGLGAANPTLAGYPFHEPVLLDAVVSYLAPHRGGMYLDGTVGGGGHAEAILQASGDVYLLAADRDGDALEQARHRLSRFKDRVTYGRGDYVESQRLFGLGEGTLAGVFLDLGVSSHQIDTKGRGFSFRPGTPLDMRMSEGEGEVTAAFLLNELGQPELADVFRRYGEEKKAAHLSAEVVRRRKDAPFKTSDDLVAAMGAIWGRPLGASDKARIFQALRIAVNRELDSLDRALPALRDLLAPEGRLVIISYHSLEDRLVKRAFREWSRECICPPGIPICRCRGRALGHELGKGIERPNDEEVARNPRARSARLRAWERAA